jgi:hypothetical protein
MTLRDGSFLLVPSRPLLFETMIWGQWTTMLLNWHISCGRRLPCLPGLRIRAKLALPRLLADLRALKTLASSPSPPLRIVRPTQVVQVLYGFANASGKGLGSTVQGYLARALASSPTNPRFRVGVWGQDNESESSNFRELANLVLTVEAEAAAGHLTRAEFYNNITEILKYVTWTREG